MIGPARVGVDVATVWVDPSSPRAVDAAAVADAPDLEAWTAALDAPARLGLHGRTETQLLRGEPVSVLERRGGWSHVVAPWQPSPRDNRGYPGWVRTAHLQPASSLEPGVPEAMVGRDRLAAMRFAAQFTGSRYLWGGLSRWGLDCSGLVHLAYRQAGVVIPRDAAAQHAAATPVALGEELPGDLYFFARSDSHVFHVGFVTGRLEMLHAPEAGELIEDAPLSPGRLATLVAAGRLLPLH